MATDPQTHVEILERLAAQFDGREIGNLPWLKVPFHITADAQTLAALKAGVQALREKEDKDQSAELAAGGNNTHERQAETASPITIPPVDGPCPMVAPTFDESGDYPSEETLQAIENWPASQINACLEFARAAWHWEDWATEELRPHEREMVHAEDGQRFLRLATGGWSGNESIIAALKTNIWTIQQWCLSARGGLHIYEFKVGCVPVPLSEASARLPSAAPKDHSQSALQARQERRDQEIAYQTQVLTEHGLLEEFGPLIGGALLSYLAEAVAASREQGWQPISTAKCLTVLLVFDSRKASTVAAAKTERGHWVSIPGRYAVTPTHWRPLPSPPKETT